jgi:hypothetical protein
MRRRSLLAMTPVTPLPFVQNDARRPLGNLVEHKADGRGTPGRYRLFD